MVAWIRMVKTNHEHQTVVVIIPRRCHGIGPARRGGVLAEELLEHGGEAQPRARFGMMKAVGRRSKWRNVGARAACSLTFSIAFAPHFMSCWRPLNPRGGKNKEL